MSIVNERWHPGSFTKNFGWGSQRNGLKELHRAIRIGFESGLTSVPREDFQARVAAKNINPYIPLNFFLFNQIRDGNSVVVFDELVFQAVEFEHDHDFDRLALFAFNLSLVGTWKRARAYQSRPALWSNRYIVERLATEHHWNTQKISADDIQDFIANDPRYTGSTSRKLATNLFYLFKLGRIRDSVDDVVERWWMNATFLAADRVCNSGANQRLSVAAITEAFLEFDFWKLTGTQTREKTYALRRLLEMYVAVGGPSRFEKSAEALAENSFNDTRPFGLVDKALPTAPKNLPAGVLNVVDWLDKSYAHVDRSALDSFEAQSFVRETTLRALSALNERSILPRISADELTKLMRD